MFSPLSLSYNNMRLYKTTTYRIGTGSQAYAGNKKRQRYRVYTDGQAQNPIHFKEETISLCHPERSEGSLAGQKSFAPLRMTILKRLRLTRNTSYLKWIGRKTCPTAFRLRP